MRHANQIKNLDDRHRTIVIETIVAEYCPRNQPVTLKNGENIQQLSQIHAKKTTSTPKEKKVVETNEKNIKTYKHTPFKHDEDKVSEAFCTSTGSDWQLGGLDIYRRTRPIRCSHFSHTSILYRQYLGLVSDKDGMTGISTNQCKKVAVHGCFCTMHFKENKHQSPIHNGLN